MNALVPNLRKKKALANAAQRRQAERKRQRGYTDELDHTKEQLTQDEVERIRL
jgi:hypothetical protein